MKRAIFRLASLLVGLLLGVLVSASFPSARAAIAVAFNGTSINSDSSLTLGTNGNTTAVTFTTGQLTQLAHALQEIYGGTNQTTYATGDTLYASGTNTLGKLTVGGTGALLNVSGGVPSWLAIGSANQVLTVSGGVPTWAAATGGTVLNSTNDFRLTISTNTPVPTSDVANSTNVYLTPTTGNRIALYASSAWAMYTSGEMTLALGTLTSGKNYDVWCYSSSGTPTLEALVWTNDTTRATALVRQDGVWSKTGDTTRRYVGTFRTISTTQTADTAAKRFIFSAANRRRRYMNVTSTDAQWAYTTATWRQANASATNQLDYVDGLGEDAVKATPFVHASNSSAAWVAVGVGVDVTNADSSQQGGLSTQNDAQQVFSIYYGMPGVGRHFLAWVEKSDAAGTTNWDTSNFNASITAGIVGEVWQ